jgi:hypothetical protein
MNTLASLAIALGLASAQTATAQPLASIQMIYMGGSDCPPCVRGEPPNFPKLQQSQIFKSISFTYVPQARHGRSAADPVPAGRSQAIQGSDGRSERRHERNRPQVAIVVDGQLYDYYFRDPQRPTPWNNDSGDPRTIAAIRFDSLPEARSQRTCLVKG